MGFAAGGAARSVAQARVFPSPLIALFDFLNRWNDTLATPLEDAPLAYGEAHLSGHGWDAGKQKR
jgi:hypothetical protein